MSDHLDTQPSPDEPGIPAKSDDRFESFTTFFLVAIGLFLLLCVLVLIIGERRPPAAL